MTLIKVVCDPENEHVGLYRPKNKKQNKQTKIGVGGGGGGGLMVSF